MTARPWWEHCIDESADLAERAAVAEAQANLVDAGWLALLMRFGYPLWSVEGYGHRPSRAVGRTASLQAQSRTPVAPQLVVRVLAAPTGPPRLARLAVVPPAPERLTLMAGQRLRGVQQGWYREPYPEATYPWPERQALFTLEPMTREATPAASDWHFEVHALMWHEDGMAIEMAGQITVEATAGVPDDSARDHRRDRMLRDLAELDR